jgi:hypothetical protein
MAKTAKHDATILPSQVFGTVSPYPIVVTVICGRKKKGSKANKRKQPQ